MYSLLCYIYFIILTFFEIKYLFQSSVIIASPYNNRLRIRVSGCEMLLILIFGTGLIALMPVLSIRLLVLEVLCVLGILKSMNRPIWSLPFFLFCIFLFWTVIGLTYTKSIMYGIRMILKYAYPLLIGLFASSVVRNNEIFLKATLLGRRVALFSLVAFFIPFIMFFVREVFWNRAAVATHYITLSLFSLGLFFFSNEKRKNLIYFVLFSLPCFIWVFRTDIMGLMVALAVFFFIRYRIKAAPLILVLAFLSVASIFYIPSVKNKMFFRPDEVTIIDFLSGNVDENNINTSGREDMWEFVMPFYENHKMIGSGTGRTQDFAYNELGQLSAMGGFGAQIHSDFLLMLCDNGIIGLMLYLSIYIAALLHCLIVYKRACSNIVRLCAVVAVSSMFGILVTMYSDNTVSYSMATLSYPWGLYGMMLGLNKAYHENQIK